MTSKSSLSGDDNASERWCAAAMRSILAGRYPLGGDDLTAEQVAERYRVHRDTVYKGVRSGSPLFPVASRKGRGPKAPLRFSPAAVAEADRNRIAFYKTTPSWHDLFGDGATAAPPRRSAKAVIAEHQAKRRNPIVV